MALGFTSTILRHGTTEELATVLNIVRHSTAEELAIVLNIVRHGTAEELDIVLNIMRHGRGFLKTFRVRMCSVARLDSETSYRMQLLRTRNIHRLCFFSVLSVSHL